MRVLSLDSVGGTAALAFSIYTSFSVVGLSQKNPVLFFPLFSLSSAWIARKTKSWLLLQQWRLLFLLCFFSPLLGPPHSTPILHVHAQRRTSFAKSFHLRRRCWTLFLYVLSWVFSCQFCSCCCWFSVVVVVCFRCSDCDGSSLSCQETRASVR